MRQRPSSAPPTNRVGSGSASPPAVSAHQRESLQIHVIPAAGGVADVVDQQLQEQMDHLALTQASPGVSAEDIFYEKRAIVEQIVEKHARLRIFELAMQIEAEPHHALQEALILQQRGLSEDVKDLLLDRDTAGAAQLHGEESVDALSIDDIIGFELPHEVKAKVNKQNLQQQQQQYYYHPNGASQQKYTKQRSHSICEVSHINVHATPVGGHSDYAPSPETYWSAAGLRHI